MNLKKLITFLIVVILILLALIAAGCVYGRRVLNERDGWRSVAKTETTVAKYWRNESGKSRGQVMVAEANIKILGQLYGKELDQVKKELGVKQKQFKYLTNLSTTTTDTLRLVLHDTIFSDTAHAKSFNYSDQWISFNGYFLRNEASFKYEVKDSLTIAHSYKKKNWFSKRELFVDVISHNPKTTLAGLSSISVPEPKYSRVGVGPFIGVGLNGKVMFGVGVSYDLIRF